MAIKNVTQNDDGSFTVKLKFPVEHANRTVKELRLRSEMTVADLEAMDKASGDVEKSMRIIAELSGCAMALLRKLKPADFGTLNKVIAEIMGGDEEEEDGDGGKDPLRIGATS